MNESEQKARDIATVAAHLPETLFVADPTLKTFQFISKPLSQVTSTPIPGLKNLAELWTRFIAPEDHQETSRTIEQALSTGETVDVAFRLIPPAGTIDPVWMELRLVPVRDATSGRVLRCTGILMDQTERRQTALRIARAQEQEILIGARIQQELLFGRPPREIPHVTVAVRTLPSQGVDGDFFDFYHYSDTVLDFLIGDVMGKGIPAALLGAAVKTAYLRASQDELVRTGVPPELTRIVMKTEQQLSRELLALGRFVTMQVCRLDSVELTLDYVDCGHTCIVHHSRRDNTVWTFDGNNMPIGFVERQDFVSRRLPLGPGDILFLYSDGLTETRNSEDDLFGVKRVMHYLAAHNDSPPEKILADLLSLVFDFSAGAIRDDVTGIIVRADGSRKDTSQEAWPLVKGSLPVDDGMTARARAFLGTHMDMLHIAGEDQQLLLLATHEAIANIWSHAYSSRSDHLYHVEITLERRSDWVYIMIEYEGEPFMVDGSTSDAPMEDRVIDLKERGYGLEIIRTVMDSVVLCEGLRGQLRLVMARRYTGAPALEGTGVVR